MTGKRLLRYYRWLGASILTVAILNILVLGFILLSLRPNIGLAERDFAIKFAIGSFGFGVLGFWLQRFAARRLATRSHGE
ncbi:hypothetical protein [Brevundimonas sp.]